MTYTKDDESDIGDYDLAEVNHIRPGVLRIIDSLEDRTESELFVVLIAGLVNDIQVDFLLNYYSAAIFYKNINFNDFKIFIEGIGIDDQTMKKMWYDETYGFGKLSTFNVYMRILIKNKTNIKTYLINYFAILPDQMNQIIDWLGGFKTEREDDLNSKTADICDPPPQKFLKQQKLPKAGLVCNSTQITYIQWGSMLLTDMI